uniref:Brevican core protein-like n=1 Tax=Stegastes partitus TaxID=144197 RepID=A0A3B4ZM95_9TELE
QVQTSLPLPSRLRLDAPLPALLCAICLLVLPSPSLLQVTIPTAPPVFAVLGGSLTLPCLVSLTHPPPSPSTNGRHAVLSVPRVKWSVLTHGRETEVLVARGDRVRVSEAYKDRASLLNYAYSPADLTLRLESLRHNDTGFYRCEVQQGLEDADDVVQVKVKGVVFHYRDASSRYAFAFEQAREACEDIGAEIATPEQLLAAYNSGYEQCDAGWLSDHSVRLETERKRSGVKQDMSLCTLWSLNLQILHFVLWPEFLPARFTFWEAKAYCLSHGAELATTAQLYAAWNDGLNHCSPGWLADGSVRYPIVTPRERCGGGEPGVRTVYRYSNQTGFPETTSRHDAYCFRKDIGQDIVFFTNPAQEEVSLSVVTPSGVEEVQRAQMTNPVKQDPVETHSSTLGYDKEPLLTVDPPQSVTPLSEHQEHLPTKDTWTPIEKVIYPESFQPAAEENPNTDDEESHIHPATSPAADGEVTVDEDSTTTSTDATTLVDEDAVEQEQHMFDTESPDTLDVNATSGADVYEQLNSSSEAHQEGDLPVSQEDHTPDVHLEHASGTELVYSSTSYDVSGQPEEASTATAEEISMVTSSPHTEETDVHSTTLLPSFDNSTPEHHPTEEGSEGESANLPPDEEMQNSVTHGLVGMNIAATSEVAPTSDSNSCLENPCLNGGTCVEGESIRCLCLPGYGGDLCHTGVCEPGWEKFQGFCYRHFSKRQSWEAAEQHCRMCGGHLLSVMTPEEQDYINDKYREYQWIGLNDRTIEGDFRWSDGSPLLYENWYKGQPDSYFLSGEDCAVMVWHDGGRWSDVPCNYHLSYTCKKGVSSCGEPPQVPFAKVFGKKRSRYETNTKVRYYCEEGFMQKLNPVIKCLPGGQWEEPLITCMPSEFA